MTFGPRRRPRGQRRALFSITRGWQAVRVANHGGALLE
jgi:hypothetical protein